MTTWNRAGTTITAELCAGRVEWLHHELLRYRDLLDVARHSGALDDDLRTVLGTDDGTPSKGLLDRVRFSINVVIASLPPSGGQVVVRDKRAHWSWIMVARDLGLLVAQRLGIAGQEHADWLWGHVHSLEALTGPCG